MGRAARLVLACGLALGVAGLAGCRDSDALKEVIYDQNSSIIDYDNPSKFYINDSSAEEESDAVSALEVSDEDPLSDVIQNLIIYSSTPNTEGFTAKRSVFGYPADFSGIEASDTVSFYQSDSVDAFDHPVTQELPEEEQEEEQEEEETPPPTSTDVQTPEQQSGSTVTNNPAASTSPETPGDQGGGETPEPTPDEDGGTANPDPEEPTNPIEAPDGTDGMTNTEGVGAPKNPTVAFDIGDRDADPPKADAVAAFGQYALAVQMIGGDGALGATDQVTYDSLTSNGVSCSAKIGWSGNTGDPSELINVKNIVESGVKLIIVADPQSYTQQLSTERYNYLTENGVQWTSLRDWSNSVNIKANVEAIGDMLQGSATAAYGADAASRAAQYVSFHDRVVSSANNGLAQDASDAHQGVTVLQYDNAADGLSYSSNTALYTVLIDYWDPGAFYLPPGLSFDAGAAYAAAGYATTPVSYYLQAGGVINNAAAVTTALDSGKQLPVLQFSQTESQTKDVWNTTALDNILYGRASILNSGIDQAWSTGLGKGLGSDVMPKLIVTDKTIKDSLVESSKSATSIYHPFGYVGNGTTTDRLGITYSTGYGDTSMWSCIGSNAQSGTAGDPNPIYPDGMIDADDVLVNPQGYFCDWTQGSLESFLEAGFAAAYISGTQSVDTWHSDVSEFYKWAWGITVDISRIDVN